MISHVSVYTVCIFLNSDSDFLVSYLARVLSLIMRAKKSKKTVEAASAYRDGRFRNAYQLRRNIKAGMCAINGYMLAVQDLRSIFDSFVHSGRDLKRCKAIYPEPAGSSYANIIILFDQNSI